MKRALVVVVLIVLVLLGGLGWLWVAQNADQTVMLRLDLGAALGAWETSEPVPATLLALAALAAGAVLGALPLWLWGIGLKNRIRGLKRQVEFSAGDF